MNVLLVYPEYPDTFWSFKHALKFSGHKAGSPPLGLLTVAAMLPSHWSKRLVDMNIRGVTEEDLVWADYAFIGAMIVQKESAQEVIARCQAAGVKVVAGGPLFTSEYEQFKGVDHFVLNEAEVTLPPFLADLEQDDAKRVYTTTEFADLETTPIPLWELADLKQYRAMSIQFSRGCPHDCEFCDVTALLGRRPRHKKTGQIIAELDSLYHVHQWRGGIFFVDDNLIGSKRYFKNELLPALIEWQKDKGNIPFNTQVDINIADDEQLMQMMHTAGFDMVFVGIETPDENVLAECGKSQNRNRNLIEDVRRIQRYGLQVQGGFIVGFDGDTPDIFERQIDFIERSGVVTAMVSLLQALPNTKLYKRLKMEDRVLDRISGDNTDATTNVATVMDRDIVLQGYQRVLHHIYSPEVFYNRVKQLFTNYKSPKVKAPLEIRSMLAILRSIYCLGLKEKGRTHYWKLMWWTLFHHPDLLLLALVLAVNGYHFRTVCEKRVFTKGEVLPSPTLP